MSYLNQEACFGKKDALWLASEGLFEIYAPRLLSGHSLLPTKGSEVEDAVKKYETLTQALEEESLCQAGLIQ